MGPLNRPDPKASADLFEELLAIDNLLRERRFADAIHALEHLRRLWPENRNLRLRLADTLVLAGRFEEARPILESLSLEFAREGFHAKAVALLKKLERLGTDSTALTSRLAEAISGEASDREPRAAFPGLVENPAPAVERRDPPPDALVRSRLFSAFGTEELRLLIRSFAVRTFEAGEILVAEGEPGTSLFVLAAGRARVYVEGAARRQREIRALEAGDFFGEISLLSGAPRSATVIAASPVEVLELEREAVARLAQRYPSIRETLREVCLARSGSPEERAARPVARVGAAPEPTAEEEAAVVVSRETIARLVPYCRVRLFLPGEAIFREGDPGSELFVVEEGSVELDFGAGLPRRIVESGGLFGELALLTPEGTRSGSAIARSPCRLIAVAREGWEALARSDPAAMLLLVRQVCGYLVRREGLLRRALESRMSELERTLTHLQHLRESLSNAESQAYTDALTGLFNRRFLDERLPRQIERATRGQGLIVAVLLLDLDSFKALNDRHGHATGDRALRRLGSLLRSAVRWTDLPCRLGGDEFVLVLSDLDPMAARRRAIEIYRAVAAFDLPGENPAVMLTASMGGAVLREGESAEELLGRADRFLYLAKNSGRGGFFWEGERIEPREPGQ